jgi:hypothetical protein
MGRFRRALGNEQTAEAGRGACKNRNGMIARKAQEPKSRRRRIAETAICAFMWIMCGLISEIASFPQIRTRQIRVRQRRARK